MTIMHMENGKIKHAWTCWDMLGIMQQLGLIPGQAPAAPAPSSSS
jgi:hypothetical protein